MNMPSPSGCASGLMVVIDDKSWQPWYNYYIYNIYLVLARYAVACILAFAEHFGIEIP